MKYTPIENDLFVENRSRLVPHLEPGSIAVFNSNDIMPTSADGVRSFIQNTDLFYLSGIDQEETILVVCPGAREEKHREILFIRETDEKTATWEGDRLTTEEATAISGVKTVYPVSQFEMIFRPLVFDSEYIYLNTNEHPRASTIVQTREARFVDQCMRDFPIHKFERLAPIMRRLRAIKSEHEIGLLQKACDITESAFKRILGVIRPGIWEFEIEAEIYHEFIRNRSRGPAYAPIIASGPNTCVLHYIKNNRQCLAGQLVLMDFGAEYANYAADLTRTVPIAGRFSPRQKAVYNAVLRVQREAIAMLRPGTSLKDYNEEVGKVMEKELIGLGLLDPDKVKAQDPEKPLYRTYFMHGTSHHLGLDVHDVADTFMELAPGMVLTCEPGIYIKDEALGVRIENDILVTDGDPVDLMADIPVEVEAIEDLMAK